MNVKFVIPARGGSKGIPGKNIKLLDGLPLIVHSIEQARRFVSDKDIIVSTDSDEILEVIKGYDYDPLFKRPTKLGSDSSGMNEVLLHVLDFCKTQNDLPEVLVLLQPTSPFRKDKYVKKALELYSAEDDVDMIVSVKETRANPYYLLVEEDKDQYLQKVKEHNSVRRQDVPNVFEYNGAVYVINVNSLLKKGLSGLSKKKKLLMDEVSSHDLDEMLDWYIAEMILEKKITAIDK